MNSLQTERGGFLSASALKIIACIFMTVDHIGAYLFPGVIGFRIAGRIAFPIFAYFIAEGCVYTRNKAKRLIILGALGVAFEGVYYLVFRKIYGNILLTFTLSVILIYSLQWLKKTLAGKSPVKTLLAAAVFCVLFPVTHKISGIIGVDYGFTGVLVPVFAAVFEGRERRDLRLFSLSAGLVLLALRMGLNNVQVWSLMAVPFLALYNGEPGNRRFKYGFYAFYPVHLAVIWLVGLIMQNV
ncbi:MAG: hypothetical protein IJ300_02025 [Clostridia bacterium]|nr:hypothetical protein [Clostridia bacterium]